MFIKRDSLLLRIIFYNAAAIIFIASIMSLLFGAMIFNELNTKLLDRSREKATFLNKAYVFFVERTKDELLEALNETLSTLEDEMALSVENNLADLVKRQLNAMNYNRYNKAFIQVISTDLHVISESGNQEIRNDIVYNSKLIPSIQTLNSQKYYFVETNKNLYVRILYSFRTYEGYGKNYIILTLPLSNYSLTEIKSYANIEKNEKVILLSKDKYVFGELDVKNDEKFLETSTKSRLSRNFTEYEYYFSEKKIGEELFYIGTVSLNDANLKYTGKVGIAISKNSFISLKYILASIILGMCVLAIVISTAICARVFSKILEPLSVIAGKTDKIGTKEKEIDFGEESIHEIRAISNSMRSMKDRIEYNDTLLREKNLELEGSLNRIVATESVLMAVDIDKGFSESIETILNALTSDIGFGYSRAIYFEFDENENILMAKDYSINSRILSNISDFTKGTNGFEFQIKNLDSIIPLLKIKYEIGNLFWESINSNKIIFHNDKGYKYNFGNELFKSLGLNNFILLPISDKEIKIGCILVDYFVKDSEISESEIETLILLLMNLIIKAKNNIFEEDKIANERIITMTKISNKFIDNNMKLIDKVETFIEKILNSGYNKKDIDTLLKIIENEKNQNKLMREVIDSSTDEFKAVDLEEIINKVIKDNRKIIDKYSIDISLFASNVGYIYGSDKKIYQMIMEIVKNSINALLVRNKLVKKINIILKNDSNERIKLEITDNGIGMLKEELEFLKKPYTESNLNIIGLGLTTVYKVIREHKASMKITSQLDEGTKIKIIFKEYKEEVK